MKYAIVVRVNGTIQTTVDLSFAEDEDEAMYQASSFLSQDGFADEKWEHIDNEPFDVVRTTSEAGEEYIVKLGVSCYYRDIIEAQDYDEMLEKLQSLVENNSVGLDIEWEEEYEEELECEEVDD